MPSRGNFQKTKLTEKSCSGGGVAILRLMNTTPTVVANGRTFNRNRSAIRSNPNKVGSTEISRKLKAVLDQKWDSREHSTPTKRNGWQSSKLPSAERTFVAIGIKTIPVTQERVTAHLFQKRKRQLLPWKKKGLNVNVRAFVWVQGESDANANDAEHYADALEAMISKLRTDLKSPACLALIAVNTQFGLGNNKWMPVIVEQQKKLAERDPRTGYVDTSKATIANAAHFDSKGTLDVGKWCAETLLRLESQLQP